MSALVAASAPVGTVVMVGNCRYWFAPDTSQADIDKLLAKARRVKGDADGPLTLPKLSRPKAPTPLMVKAMRSGELRIVDGDGGRDAHLERIVASAKRKGEPVDDYRAKYDLEECRHAALDRLQRIADTAWTHTTDWKVALSILIARDALRTWGVLEPVAEVSPTVDAIDVKPSPTVDTTDAEPASPTADDSIPDMKAKPDLSELEAHAVKYRKLRAVELAAREELHAMMREAEASGAAQADIARATGWHRQHVNRLLKRS